MSASEKPPWKILVGARIKMHGQSTRGRTHGDRKEEHTREHSDGHTRTNTSNTNMEQHGTRITLILSNTWLASPQRSHLPDVI